ITISTESSLGKIIQLINKTDSTKNRFTNQISIRNQVHLLNKINEKKNFLLGQKIKWLPKKWLSDNKQLKIKTLLKKELIQLSEAIEYLYPKAESQGKNKTRLKKENISEGIFNIIKEEKPREIKKETTRIIEEKPILKKENPQKLMSFINDLGYENIDEEELELFLNKILIKDYKKIFYRIRSKRMIDDSNIELFNFISLETIHTIMELQGKNKIKPYFNILSESIKEGKIKAAINYETLLHQAKGENKKDVFIYIESIVRSSEKYNTNLLAPIVETIKEEIKKQQKENIDDKTSNKIKKEQLKQTIEILDVIKEQNEKEPERKILSNDKQIYNTLVQEGLFVQNVGLVLLWPFFTRFFRLTGVLEKGTKQFQSKEQSIKAIFLLEYLATKRTEAEEHELILNKILCGVPLTESVPLSYELTEEEKNIANSLLGAVVAQWKALKSTSPDGLRGAFLFREGRIMREGSNYRVTVERKTLDILINKMPWSFAMIKLPWLNDLIFVEWT
ncbi:MAG: contractile injection system tape measure protein, partial [Saprospiraceae bacterium]